MNYLKLQKIWNSPSFTGAVNALLSPVRYIILTPLILTHFSRVEISTYFLITSAMILMTFVNARLCTAFTTMLAFSYSGSDSLKAKSSLEGASVNDDAAPNWRLYHETTATLKYLQKRFAIPLSFVGSLLIFKGVGDLTDWNLDSGLELWLIIPAIFISTLFDILTSAERSMCMAVGQVSLINRNSFIYLSIDLVVSIIVVCLTKSLLWMMVIRCLVQTAQRINIRRICVSCLSNIHDEYREVKAQLYKHVFDQARPAVIKSLIGVLTDKGAMAVLALYVVTMKNTWGEEQVAAYLFTQNLASFGSQFCYVPIAMNLPKLSQLLASSNRSEFLKLSKELIIGSLLLALVIFSGIFFIIPIFSDLLELNVKMIDGGARIILFCLLFIRVIQTQLALLHNATNQIFFYKRNIISFTILLVLLYCVNYPYSLSVFLLVSYGTYIIVYGVAPIREFLKITKAT